METTKVDSKIREQVLTVLAEYGLFDCEPVWESLGMTKEELNKELEKGSASGISNLTRKEVRANFGLY